MSDVFQVMFPQVLPKTAQTLLGNKEVRDQVAQMASGGQNTVIATVNGQRYEVTVRRENNAGVALVPSPAGG